MRILFAGGGTGGHFFPILALIREIKTIAEEERILDLELFYMGPNDFAIELLKDENVVVIPIFAGKLRRYFSLQNFLDVFKTFLGLFQGMWNMVLIMPDVVFAKGGYGSLPAVVAAIIFRIPLVIHESDAVPGKVNQYAGRFASRIGIAFASSAQFFPQEKVALVGIPIRKRILGGSKETARENFDIFSSLPAIGIIGASQGSQKINEVVIGVLKELTQKFEIIHQTGKTNYEDVKGEGSVILEFAHKERYHPVAFLNEPDMRNFYAASDLIVSRAGASSIFEIAAWGKPSILIPLKNSAQDHQRKNASEYASGGAAEIIEETNLTPHILLAQIEKIIENKELMRNMSAAAQRFSRIDASTTIAREILKLGVH